MELKSKSFKIERIGLKPPLGKPSNKFDNVKTWTRGSFLFLIVQHWLLPNEKNKLRWGEGLGWKSWEHLGCTMCLLKEVNGSGGWWGEDFQKVIFPMNFFNMLK